MTLASGDTVTCTYSDRLTPPTAGLLLAKITRGALGTFGFSVDPVTGGATLSASATTTATGVAAPALPVFDALAPGSYDIDEDAPSTRTPARGRSIASRATRSRAAPPPHNA